MSSDRWKSLLSLLGVLMFTGISCDESLPPRYDPPEVLVASVAMNSRIVTFDTDTVRAGGAIEVRVRNNYSEVLSEEARIHVQLSVWRKDRPDSIRTLICTADDLPNTNMLDYKTLTIRTRDTLRLVHNWDHRNAIGSPFWAGRRLSLEFTGNGTPYYQSDTVQILVTGKAQVFSRVQAIDIPLTELAVVYRLFHMPQPPPPAKP